jgi:hypothetical protein
MKILNRILWIVLLFGSIPGELKAAGEENRWVEAVRGATDPVLSTSPNPDRCKKGLAQLLDVIAEMAARDSRLPAELRTQLKSARKVFAADPFSTDSYTAVQSCYKAAYKGKDFAFPDEVRTAAAAGRLALQHVEEGIQAIGHRQLDQAIRDLLSFIALVITPMMQ